MGPMPIIPIAPREREHKREHGQEVSLNPTNEQIAHVVPDLNHSERELEVQNLGGLEDKGIVPMRPSTAAPEHTHDNDQVSEGAHNTVQSGGSKSECRQPW